MTMADETEVRVYVRQVDADDLSHHRPQHVYEAIQPCPLYGRDDGDVVCQMTSNVNESFLWCEECGESGSWTQLRKSFQSQGIAFAQVWQASDTPNLSTGKIESDPRKFKEHLYAAGQEMAERIGMPVNYEPVDMTDRDALGVTDEGMDATHDRAVAEGRKDSRGRFVF